MTFETMFVHRPHQIHVCTHDSLSGDRDLYFKTSSFNATALAAYGGTGYASVNVDRAPPRGWHAAQLYPTQQHSSYANAATLSTRFAAALCIENLLQVIVVRRASAIEARIT